MEITQHTYTIHWRRNSRITGHSIITKSILRLKSVPICVTFCKCETAELICCQANPFVHYNEEMGLRQSAVFSILPGFFYLFVWGLCSLLASHHLVTQCHS